MTLPKVWVLTGQTESGDSVGPYVFDYKPTNVELVSLLKEDMPQEFEGDPEDDWVDPEFGYISSWYLAPEIVRSR